MKKLLSLLTLMIVAITTSWADTETPGYTGTSNTTLTGKSYSIDGDFIAGAGGKAEISPMETRGVKFRTNRSSNTLVISVNAGYRIDALTIYGITNDNSKTSSISGVSVDGTDIDWTSVSIPAGGDKNTTTAATISIPSIAATDNITLTFSGSATQVDFDLHFTYTQTSVVTQEITGATLNGSAISDTDLATLKENKAVTIDGSSLNGSGLLGVTLSSGAVTPTKTFDGTSAVYTFTINSTDEYTVTVTNVAKTYDAAEGSVVDYAGATLSSGDKVLTENDVTFTYASKTFGYGNGRVTLGEDEYQPIKLSTGEGVNVTFPDGKKATKIIVYGWSADGTGYMKTFKDGEAGENSIATSDNKFYAKNETGENYPSVYEYTVDNWEALYFECAGGQPFVVVDFVFASATETIEIPSDGVLTYVTQNALDFSTINGAFKAYVPTSVNEAKTSVATAEVTSVPAGTALLLKGAAGAYDVEIAESATAPAANLFQVSDGSIAGGDNIFAYSKSALKFKKVASTVTIPAGKCYLQIDGVSGDALDLDFEGEATAVEAIAEANANAAAPVKVIKNGKLYIGNYNVAGQQVK